MGEAVDYLKLMVRWSFALLSASAVGATTAEADAAAERIPGLDLDPPKEVRT